MAGQHPLPDLSALSTAELLALTRGRLSIPTASRRPKSTLLHFILMHASTELLGSIVAAVLQRSTRTGRSGARNNGMRRRHPVPSPSIPSTADPTDSYLVLPTEAERHACYRAFYDATGAKALETWTCAICAREVNVVDESATRVRLHDLPHRERLHPTHPHPAHDLYEGCLLDPAASAADGTYRPAPDTLQRAMRGTVSSYELSNPDVLSMIEGNLMPQKPAVLASVLSITFVAVGALPKQWLRSTFRVRRHHVREALLWLKHNNERYYGNITISEDRLQALPDDDVPTEVLDIVRQCDDPGIADQEGAGYVPTDDDEGDELAAGSPHDDPSEDATAPDVIPLTVSGAIDTDLSRMTANELMAWGLANLWSNSKEGLYGVRYARQPTTAPTVLPPDSSPLPNYFERAFPCLFPYGRGGMEAEHTVPFGLREHVQWALQYHDRRFRTHETFAFRRQALGSARVQMRQKAFDEQSRTLSAITADGLKQAAQEEASHLPISNPGVRLLQSLVHGTAGRVEGSDASRYKIRGQIWSTCLAYGPPSLWITINPSDIHDPIAQVFAGAAIDMDHFVHDIGPSADERARAIAADPFAAAKFFHFIVRTILVTLFRIEVTPYVVHGHRGVLGTLSAYVGAVESQGRGTLHLHMLLWLAGTPSPERMAALLKTDDFRDRVQVYIRENLRAYLPGLDSAETARAIPRDKDITYNRPPHPDSTTYSDDLHTFELRLARTHQLHKCKPRRCQFYDANGKLTCKRRAPFECADDDYIHEDGRWGQKRLYAYMNGWNPAVLINARCNNDAKLLTNGSDTKNITFYVSSYAGKKQGKNYNMSAVLAQGFAYHESHPKEEYTGNIREQHRLLLFRLVNAINREQELAAPMVMSYLMGWGDVKTSHSYSPLYWSSFLGALRRTFPPLRSLPRASADEDRNAETVDGDGNDMSAEGPPLPPHTQAAPSDEQVSPCCC
ncbi:hypothetical protein OH77DRAFT_1582337 [Trametes cingulata]|nr:hypothetical protein OH77DRAFT_1582337 [Trametes cingulata]